MFIHINKPINKYRNTRVLNYAFAEVHCHARRTIFEHVRESNSASKLLQIQCRVAFLIVPALGSYECTKSSNVRRIILKKYSNSFSFFRINFVLGRQNIHTLPNSIQVFQNYYSRKSKKNRKWSFRKYVLGIYFSRIYLSLRKINRAAVIFTVVTDINKKWVSKKSAMLF